MVSTLQNKKNSTLDQRSQRDEQGRWLVMQTAYLSLEPHGREASLLIGKESEARNTEDQTCMLNRPNIAYIQNVFFVPLLLMQPDETENVATGGEISTYNQGFNYRFLKRNMTMIY